MNPFDEAPSGAPASFDPPSPVIQPAPRRGRTALVALAAAGLTAGGLVAVSQFVSAERPSVSPQAGDEVIAAPDTVPDEGGDQPSVEGKIVISTGDGEPIVIDLGEGTVDGQPFDKIVECLGFDGEFGRMFEDFGSGEFGGMFEDFAIAGPGGPGHMGGMPFGEFGMFASDGTHVSVMGPDGVSMVDLGDGDGSVTISQKDGEVTIEVDGSATVTELGEMLGAIELPELEELDFEELLPGDLGDFDFELPADLQACLAGADG